MVLEISQRQNGVDEARLKAGLPLPPEPEYFPIAAWHNVFYPSYTAVSFIEDTCIHLSLLSMFWNILKIR